MKEITAKDLMARLDRGEIFQILDVRETDEVQVSMIEGAIHIPMDQIVQRIYELDPSVTTVVVCRKGVRSARITDILDAVGFTAYNLVGGMQAVVNAVDPSIPVA